MREQSEAPATIMMRRPALVGVPAMPTLAALLGQAFPSERWDAAGTERELFWDETVWATSVVAAEGRLAATASLQARPDAPERGWVRWVATDRDRRRQGLARTLVIEVLAMAGHAGCREVRLRTQTDPLAAIPLHGQLGFEPFVTSDPERQARERVTGFCAAMEHRSARRRSRCSPPCGDFRD